MIKNKLISIIFLCITLFLSILIMSFFLSHELKSMNSSNNQNQLKKIENEIITITVNKNTSIYEKLLQSMDTTTLIQSTDTTTTTIPSSADDNNKTVVMITTTAVTSSQLIHHTSQVSVILRGRLGNQLFQAASSYGISVSRGASAWCIKDLDNSILQQSVVFNVQPVKCQQQDAEAEVYISEDKKNMEFQSDFMNASLSHNNVLVGDYLQSFRYFLSSGLPFQLKTQKFGEEWVKKHNVTVGIHVRRTDLIADKGLNGKDLSMQYFKVALDKLRQATPNLNIVAVVCTDDGHWVLNQPVFDNMIIRYGTDPVEDMAILAACQNFIMSIGTFGWWSGYLNPHINKNIVYYATPYTAQSKYSDHFPPDWIPVTDEDISQG